MKKNYLAPKSETLTAILKDMCDAVNDPTNAGVVSNTTSGGGVKPIGGAPVRSL